jgi:hypothetical protein
MGSRTVRLDKEAESALREIRRITGMTISEALKRGLLVLRQTVRDKHAAASWEVYERIDLGPGGYAAAPASRSKQAVADAMRRKHRR